jgi:hypothetical protein
LEGVVHTKELAPGYLRFLRLIQNEEIKIRPVGDRGCNSPDCKAPPPGSVPLRGDSGDFVKYPVTGTLHGLLITKILEAHPRPVTSYSHSSALLHTVKAESLKIFLGNFQLWNWPVHWFIKGAAQFLDGGIKTILKADRRFPSRPLRRSNHGIGIGGREGHGFFANDMAAGREARKGCFRMFSGFGGNGYRTEAELLTNASVCLTPSLPHPIKAALITFPPLPWPETSNCFLLIRRIFPAR